MIEKALVHQRIYWGSYLVLFGFVIAFWNSFVGGRIIKSVIIVILGGLFVRARFLEPQIVQVKHTTIDLGIEKRVALIADLHLGVYKDWRYLQRVVDRINEENPEIVLIAGDFLFYPVAEQNFESLFAPLADLAMPVYAVLGNHDIPVSGNNDRDGLVQTLKKYGVAMLHNDVIRIDTFYLVGLGPHMGGEDDGSVLDTIPDNENVIVMMHNPDTMTKLPGGRASLAVAGHTHCGQVRLPWIHDWIRSYYYPVDGEYDCGLTVEKQGLLFITAGLGEVMLPLRFRSPPTIDILSL